MRNPAPTTKGKYTKSLNSSYATRNKTPIRGKKYLFISIFDLHIKLSYNFSLIYKISFFDSDSLNDKEIFSNATFNT